MLMLPRRMLHVLLLMVLLCDVEASCPPDVNPLTLEPYEVIAAHGGEVLINCTSTYEDHWKLSWWNGTREVLNEQDQSFLTWAVPLSDWNQKAQCKIRLNETHECSKDLELTLYKTPTIVLFPTKSLNHAVAGTEYELQCDIIDVAPVQNLIVTWYKDSKAISTQSFHNKTKTPVSESSSMVVNATGEDNGAVFRCEARLDFGPHGPKPPPVFANHVLFVHYAPEFINGGTQSSNEFHYVKHGEDVTLSCDMEGNPPPHFQWNLDGKSVNETTRNFTVTDVKSNTVVTCTASNYLGNIKKYIFITEIKDVTRASAVAVTTPEPLKGCPLTLMPAELVVRFGDPASVNCSTSATDASGMGWEATFGGTRFENPPSVIWKVEKLQEWFINPRCYITLKHHQCTAEPAITLYKTPDAVAVSAFTPGPMVEGAQSLLRCDVTNVAPVRDLSVTWLMDEEVVHVESFNDTGITPVNVSSVLIVIPGANHNGKMFTCRAELHLGPMGPDTIPMKASEPYVAVVHYKPVMHDCPPKVTGVEHLFRLESLPCRADGNPPPSVLWYHEGKRINVSEPLSRAHSGKYKATLSNERGRADMSVDVTIEYGPSFTCGARYEVKEYEVVRMCEPEGKPAPSITWRKDGKVFPFRQNWTKHDSGRYELSATNKHGTAHHVLNLDVLFAPEFKEGYKSLDVSPGENVTLACSAEGNPVPEIRWDVVAATENVMKTTGGRQTNVTVTGATSTNAGVYICVATNKVGSVSRSVTLKMRGLNRRLSIIWWVLILCCLLLLLLLIFVTIIVCRHRRKHGQYSFIPAARQAYDIPLATTPGGE